jgi:hypothetical protein
VLLVRAESQEVEEPRPQVELPEITVLEAQPLPQELSALEVLAPQTTTPMTVLATEEEPEEASTAAVVVAMVPLEGMPSRAAEVVEHRGPFRLLKMLPIPLEIILAMDRSSINPLVP